MVATVFGEDRTFFRILETLPKASRMVLALCLGPGKVNEPGAPQGFAVTSFQALGCR